MAIDHVGITAGDIDKTVEFYLAALKPLGYRRIVTIGDGTVNGLGSTFPDFWISSMAPTVTSATGESPPRFPHPTFPLHLCFSATTRRAVREFHAAALAAGGKDNGAPGLRNYHRFYYGAFVLDHDGRNVEVVCHRPPLLADYGSLVIGAVVAAVLGVGAKVMGYV